MVTGGQWYSSTFTGSNSRRLKTGQPKAVASTWFEGRRELRWALSSPIMIVTELDGVLQ